MKKDIDKNTRQKLDNLIQKYATTVVGTWYIDIIVDRDKYVGFIDELTNLWLIVIGVSWWCKTSEHNTEKFWCPHWYGWPWGFSWWYYSEMCHDFEDYSNVSDNEINVRDHNNKVKSNIPKKVTYGRDGEDINFKDTQCLTSGIWLEVEWNNCFEKKKW